MMKSLIKMTWMETKLFLREPVGAFFTLIFPLMMLFLFGSIYGNTPTAMFDRYGTVDISVPAYTAMIIATTGLVGLTITMSAYRENGVLRPPSDHTYQPAGRFGRAGHRHVRDDDLWHGSAHRRWEAGL